MGSTSDRHLKYTAVRAFSLQTLDNWMKAHAIRDHQHFTRGRCGNQFLAGRFIIGHGFFEQDVNAGIETGASYGRVQIVGQREQYGIYRVQYLAIIRRHAGSGKLLRDCFCAFGNDIDGSGQCDPVAQGVKPPHVGTPHAATSDHTQFDHVPSLSLGRRSLS